MSRNRSVCCSARHRLIIPNDELKALYEGGMSLVVLAARYKCSTQSIRQRLKKSVSTYPRLRTKYTDVVFVAKYKQYGSATKVANELGCDLSTVCKHLKKVGIKIVLKGNAHPLLARHTHETSMLRKQQFTKEFLSHLYITKGLSLDKIGMLYHVRASWLRQKCDEYGIALITNVLRSRNCLPNSSRRLTTIPELIAHEDLTSVDTTFVTHFPVNMGEHTTFVDIKLLDYPIYIYIDGCHWHGCPKHKHWVTGVDKRMAADKAQTEYLQSIGKTVLRFWECALKENKHLVSETIIPLIKNRIVPVEVM
jgi:DNA mismatch endonuclease (patch repair protein)